ncbi:hypothetical protein, partial [Nocardiopsis halophila]|uniref:hypothetical protein n=1 Tax=Nocardiopsis halophila TaxID=141692 RepID=UPI0019D4000C
PARACWPGGGALRCEGEGGDDEGRAAPRGWRSAAGPLVVLASLFFAFRAYRARRAVFGHREW